MEHTVEEEEERIKAIQRHLGGERPVDIYKKYRAVETLGASGIHPPYP